MTHLSSLRSSRLLLPLAFGALVLAACSSGGDAATPASSEAATSSADTGSDGDVVTDDSSETRPVSATGGSITVLVQSDPAPVVGWTPWDNVCAWACRNVLDQVLETLTVVLPDGSVEPWLAESVTPNAELTEWTVVLRDGIGFTDGTSFDAAAVKRGFDSFVKEGKATESLLRDARVSGVRVIDSRTLAYDLSEPNAGFPALLAGPVGRVFSSIAAQNEPAVFLRNPIGTGPFTFESWEIGSDVVLVANPDYWRKDADGNQLPLLDGLRFVEVPDEEERLERLRNGEGQVMSTRAPRAVQQARQLQMTVISRVEDNVGAIVFNTLEPPFDDARVRRGLLLASEQAALLDASGVADVTPAATQWWSSDSIWFSQRAADFWPQHDLDEARRLLAEYQADPARSDEVPDQGLLEVRVQCTDDLQLSNMIRELERQWEATGLVNVTLETVSRSGLIQRVMGAVTDRPSFSGDFDVTCWRLGGESDPWALLSTSTGPVKTSPLNIANIENERLTELVELVQRSSTLAARRAAIEQVTMLLAVEAPTLLLGHATTAVVGTDEVTGLGAWTLPDGTEVFGQIGGVGHYAEVARS